jgi:hypothetical protein
MCYDYALHFLIFNIFSVISYRLSLCLYGTRGTFFITHCIVLNSTSLNIIIICKYTIEVAHDFVVS